MTVRRRTAGWRRAVPLVGAAAVVLAAIWSAGLLTSMLSPRYLPDDRAVVRARVAGTNLEVDWDAERPVEVWVVRLLDPDGGVLLERETAGVGLTVPLTSLGRSRERDTVLIWQVRGLDRDGNVVAVAEPFELVVPRTAP